LISHASETSSASKFSHSAGVIYNIMSLQSDVKVNEFIECLISNLSYNITHAPGPRSKIYIDAVGCEGPEMSIRYIQNKLLKLEPDNKWQYQNLLEQVKATCFSPHIETFIPTTNKEPRKLQSTSRYKMTILIKVHTSVCLKIWEIYITKS